VIRCIGRLLRRVRAGERKLLWNDPRLAAPGPSIGLTSASFAAQQRMPIRHAGRGVGDNVSPPLSWGPCPDGTQEIVLALEDPDAPLPSPFLHLLVFGLPAACTSLADGELSSLTPPARLGINSFGRSEYAGPRALRGHGPHRYAFELFALSKPLGNQVRKRSDFLRHATGSVLARGRLDVLFERPD
jgi:Raf kinase inhibitor-like YbhB/YbcL family protein